MTCRDFERTRREYRCVGLRSKDEARLPAYRELQRYMHTLWTAWAKGFAGMITPPAEEGSIRFHLWYPGWLIVVYFLRRRKLGGGRFPFFNNLPNDEYQSSCQYDVKDGGPNRDWPLVEIQVHHSSKVVLKL